MRVLALEVVLLVALALGLRLYDIAGYTTFQGDQGVDALAARHLLVDHVLPLVGPATSAGGVHLGPLYYYLLAGPMLIARLDPLGDAVCMAALGALAVGLVHLLAHLWFGRVAALVAAVVFAISPAAIEASRSAWNPAPAPFFAGVGLVGLAAFRRRQDGRWLVLVGVAMSCLIQLHYFALGLVLVVLVASAWLVFRAAEWRTTGWALLGVILGCALLAPFIIHQIADGYPDVRAAVSLGTGVAVSSDSLPRRVYAAIVPGLVGIFVAARFEPLAVLATVVLVAGLVAGALGARTRYPCLLLGAILLILVIQTVLYRGPIPQHYLLAYAPVAYLGLAAAVGAVPRWPAAKAAAGIGLVGVVAVNVINAPFGSPAGQLARSEEVARSIESAAGSGPFGLWLIADGDSAGAYRFQLERLGHPPVDTAQALPPQLFVVCQAPSTPCDLNDVRASAGPEWTTSYIDWEAQIQDVHIQRLVVASPE